METPDKRACHTRADVQMAPVPSLNDIAGDLEDQTLNELVSELAIESDSDNGSDMNEECDAYLPREYDIDNEVLFQMKDTTLI